MLVGKERHKLQNIHHVRWGEGLWKNKQGVGRALNEPVFSSKQEDAHRCRARRGSGTRLPDCNLLLLTPSWGLPEPRVPALLCSALSCWFSQDLLLPGLCPLCSWSQLCRPVRHLWPRVGLALCLDSCSHHHKTFFHCISKTGPHGKSQEPRFSHKTGKSACPDGCFENPTR